PLTGENRYITKIGLDKLRREPHPGLAALMAEAGVRSDRINSTTIGFTLAPRINAAGRLGRVAQAAELMLEQDPDRAARLAAELCDMNRERQRLEADIWSQAQRMLESAAPEGPIVLAGEGWHQGVIGIAASRLAETYAVPAVMISLDGDQGKGSCRSYGGFNLFDALSACGDLLDAFGGHVLAAGLNIPRQNVDAFRTALQKYYREHPPEEDRGLFPDVLIDRAALLTLPCVESPALLEPCGTDNPHPSFCLTGALLTAMNPIGGGKHTFLRLEKFGQTYDCVWFSHRSGDTGLSTGCYVDAIFYPQISEYRGRSVQLVIQAMRRSDLASLYRRLLSGEDAQDTALHRGDLARLWRSLERCCPLQTQVNRLTELEPHLSPAKIALGLRVLSELSLARYSLDGDEIRIVLLSRGDKADLMQSAVWRKYHV
ncbi:MAG: single-stranded-DNA-specific exonuclease RecJ, partial [Oscillospiraceae bacterium]|nr:single-stranded-DNA-specific exonuclease RecJ [Oscillospiraceae bacterium]